jgi:hypothetical protein
LNNQYLPSSLGVCSTFFPYVTLLIVAILSSFAVPYAPEPFQTLGMVYDELGSTEKSLQFLLIAAHLQRTDIEEWTRLGELALECGKEEQALSCYA